MLTFSYPFKFKGKSHGLWRYNAGLRLNIRVGDFTDNKLEL